MAGQIERPHSLGRSIAAKRRLPARWTAVHVHDRLEEAYATLVRLPMNTRPKAHGNGMPSYVHEFADLVAQGETGELERLARTRNQ